MQIPYGQLQKINTPLVKFIGSLIQVEGTINLSMTAGMEPRQSTVRLTFLVVRVSLTYNGILGQLGLKTFKAMVSTYHLLMKFLTSVGIREV